MYTARVTGRCYMYNVKIQTNKLSWLQVMSISEIKRRPLKYRSWFQLCSFMFVFSDDNFLDKTYIPILHVSKWRKSFLVQKIGHEY